MELVVLSYLELQDAGLTDDTVGVTITPGHYREFTYASKWLMRVGIRKNTPDEEFISVIRLTRTGREIARVLKPLHDEDYFQSIGRMLSKELGDKGRVTWKPLSEEEWRIFGGRSRK